MKKVCIVVPVYKQSLNMFEKISLCQLLRLLGNYPVCLIQPYTIKIEYEELSGCKYSVCKFDERYFKNTASYSELMLSSFFYEIFLDFEYILIYQLDCFVFSDRLREFCDMGYDYIGAPQYHAWTKNVVVGNGGFSLRKVDSSLNVTKRYKEIVKDSYYRDFFRKWEDNFFSYCGGKSEVDFSVPDISLANTFSVVLDIERGIQDIPVRGLPFGTHAWHRLNFEFWKKIIEAYGYKTEYLIAKNNVDTLNIDWNRRYRTYFLNNFYSLSLDMKQKILEELGIVRGKKYIMWGAGHFSKWIIRALYELKLDVFAIYDSKPKVDSLYGIAVKYPDFEEIRQHELIVLVSSEAYEQEIEYELIKNDCVNIIKVSSILKEKWEVFRKICKGIFPTIEGITVPFYFLDDDSWISDIVCRL